jgi:hypothetical protein
MLAKRDAGRETPGAVFPHGTYYVENTSMPGTRPA